MASPRSCPSPRSSAFRLRRIGSIAFASTLALRTLGGPFETPGIQPPSDAFLLWDRLLTLRAGGGFKDNALLAAFDPQDTPLATTGIELFLTRLPVDGHAVTAFFSGDLRRYLDPVQVPGDEPAREELLLITQASYKFYGRKWVPAVSFTHVRAEQVFDATDLGGDPGAVRARGDSFILAPSLRYKVAAAWWVQAEYVATRQLFKTPVSSYWEYGPKAVLGWQPHTNTTVELSWQYIDRPFDTRLQTDPLGQPLSGTRLTTYDNRLELAWRQTWYAPWKLQTTLRGFTLSRLENGEGFSDYDRIGGSLTARVEIGRWGFRGLARWSTFDFPLQIVSVFDPVPRTREETEFEARVEYRWSDRLRTYAEFLHERQHSNVQADRYHSNTAQGGVEVDF